MWNHANMEMAVRRFGQSFPERDGANLCSGQPFPERDGAVTCSGQAFPERDGAVTCSGRSFPKEEPMGRGWFGLHS